MLSSVPSIVRVIQGDSRAMPELADDSVDLVVTSPPYWQIKDYGAPVQIGWGQTLHEYLFDLARVWGECARVLKPGRRLCVNIGDQFARALIYGRYKIIPLHAEVIAQAQAVGLDYLGAIIWQKKTTMNTSGGAVVMGSFPHPPNGIVELDYEYILLFKKPGPSPKISPERKSASRLTTEEWKQYFLGHWAFGGVRQGKDGGHDAMFPDELPRRLIRMFSFVGDTVLDPFLGSSTTAQVACELDREAIGYEVNPAFLPLVIEKLGIYPYQVTPRSRPADLPPPPANYRPLTEDAAPLQDPGQFRFGADQTYKVQEIIDEHTLRLDTGLAITLLGVRVPIAQAARTRLYFDKYLRGKSSYPALRHRLANPTGGDSNSSDGLPIPAYVQLANKLFINRKMIEMGLAARRPVPVA